MDKETKMFVVKIVAIVVIAMSIIMLVAFFGAFYFYKNILSVQNSNSNIHTNFVKDENINDNRSLFNGEESDLSEMRDNNNSVQNSLVTGASTINKGMIKWQKPENVGDLGFFVSPDEDCRGESKYYKVGKVIAGDYKNYDIYVVDGYACDMMGRFAFRMLKNGDKKIFFDGRKRFDDWAYDTMKTYIGGENFNSIINGNLVIEELVYPEKIVKNGITLSTREYVDNFFYDDSYKILKKVLTTKYGDVWMTDREEADEIFANKKNRTPEDYDKYNIFNANGFYVKAPDSTVVKYVLKYDFVPADVGVDRIVKLPITWKDGEKNKFEFELYPVGCGLTSFAYDKTTEVDLNRDLKSVGTVSGSTIYGYKNTDSESFKKWYKELYWEENGKRSPEEVLKDHPIIFWIDPFSRILAFYNTKFISPAECGKPVIYLYPEQKMDVSVKVKPTGGFSVTDPDYGEDGWFVNALPSGEIYNYNDSKKYEYLFWEGHSSTFVDNSGKGFVMSKNELGKFFDETLAELGLNNKEINDFEEFWLPKMQSENKPYYFISFMSNSFINTSAPLTIAPKPDTIIRILMNYEGLDEFRDVEPQKLYAPERKGFTVVEWGGVLH